MNDFVTVSFRTFVECIDLASGEPDVFVNQMIKRTGNHDEIRITNQGRPSFSIQLKDLHHEITAQYVNEYAQELETWL